MYNMFQIFEGRVVYTNVVFLCIFFCVFSHFLIVLVQKASHFSVREDMAVLDEARDGGPEVHVGHYLSPLQLSVELVEERPSYEVHRQKTKEPEREREREREMYD